MAASRRRGTVNQRRKDRPYRTSVLRVSQEKITPIEYDESALT